MKGLFRTKVFALLTVAVFLTSLFSFSVYAGVPPPVLRTVPEQAVWIADGVTQYKVTIEGDSHLSPDQIWGVDARLLHPTAPGYTFSLVSINLQPENDFFAGSQTFPLSSLAQWRFSRAVMSNPPFQRVGNTAEFFFTVSATSSSLEPVETSFGFDGDYTSFVSLDQNQDPYNIAFEPQSIFFTIQAPVAVCPADLDDGTSSGNPDGGVDVNDLLFFLNRFEAGSMDADLDDGTSSGNPDGGVDVNDLLFFLSHFEEGC